MQYEKRVREEPSRGKNDQEINGQGHGRWKVLGLVLKETTVGNKKKTRWWNLSVKVEIKKKKGDWSRHHA